MDYKDCVILKIISEEKNLTKTAERLYISQPALSYRLQNLEKDIGVKILNRHSNGVYFTPQGEYLLKYAEEMIAKFEAVKCFIRSMDSLIPLGTLRLGVSTVIAKFKMAPLLKSFNKQFPDVEVMLKTGSSTLQLPDMLQKKEIDVALLRGDILWTGDKHVIAEEPLCLIFSRPVNLEQLPQIPWIQYESSAITKSDEQNLTWWREQFSCPPPAITMVDSIEACIQMVSHGFGWCIVPKIHVINRRSLFSCPITWRDGQNLMRKTIMIYNREALAIPVSKLFIEHVLQHYC